MPAKIHPPHVLNLKVRGPHTMPPHGAETSLEQLPGAPLPALPGWRRSLPARREWERSVLFVLCREVGDKRPDLAILVAEQAVLQRS